MRDQDIKALIEYRLKEADEALKDAELLLNADRHRSAANRMYYAAFYSANERQQDDYMPFVEMDPDELRGLLGDVRNMVNGISTYVKENA